MKDTLDSLDIFVAVKELKELEGGIVDKIYQKDDELFIRIRKNGKNEIFIKNGKWICLSERREGGAHPPPFAMALRKYLSGGRVEEIRQHEFDRIIVINVLKGGRYSLIIELIPNGNIVLVDEHNIILNAMFQQKWSSRIIKAGYGYKFPPSKENPLKIDFDDFKKIFTERDVVRSIVKNLGFAGKWAEEICSMANIDKKMPVSKLNDNHMKKLYDSMKKLLLKLNEPEPVIVDGIDVLPFPISKYEGMEIKKFESMNKALDEFYFSYLANITEEEEKFHDERERMKRLIKQQKEGIERFREMAARFREEGEAIFSNYEEVERKIREKEFVRYEHPKAWIEIEHNGKNMQIEIDVRKNAMKNAQDKYNTAKKMEEKMKRAMEAMKKAMKEMDEKKFVKEERKKAKKRLWFENYRWFITSDGNLVIAGRDAKSNEKVVKKYMKDDDIYIHADIHGAPSCVLKAQDVDGNKKEIREKSIEEACHFAVIYSKAWSQFYVASAYWVYPQQVSKTPPSGEFLPTGAFMIRGKRNYVEAEMKLAIGKIEIKGEEKIMGGPPDAIKKWCREWVILTPGGEDKAKMAKKIAEILNADVEDVIKAMPSGKFSIKEVKNENTLSGS
ncbi:MAG: NFACT family protein [Thermoplasmata archaeon]|nr:NFACT family protein [Thermoplasmata archaeon]